MKQGHDISLALSGSGFKFPAHVGVISATEELGKNVVEIAGSSGGALIGGLYACGTPIKSLYDFSVYTKWTKFLSPSLSAFKQGGILTLDSFTEELKSMTDGKRFSDLDDSVNLIITASDLLSHTPVIFSKDTSPDVEIHMAIRASIAIPVLFTPVRMDGYVLTDGALFNYLPINLLKRTDAHMAGMKVTYRGIFQDGHLRWPWHTGMQSAYGMVDRGNQWAVQHFADLKGIKISNMNTGFVNGLDPFISTENRVRLFEVGRNSLIDTFTPSFI